MPGSFAWLERPDTGFLERLADTLGAILAGIDPRHVLRKAVEPWQAMGLEPMFAYEHEFFVLEPGTEDVSLCWARRSMGELTA